MAAPLSAGLRGNGACMNTPVVSILMAVHNGEKTVAAALDSMGSRRPAILSWWL